MYVVIEFMSSQPYAVPASYWDEEGTLTVEEAGQTIIFKDLTLAENFARNLCQFGKVVTVPEHAESYIDGLYFEDLEKGVIDQ